MTEAPKMTAGDILGIPILKIDYATDADKIAALLPPGLDPSDSSNVHLAIYNVPVPDEPEKGIVVSVDADYRGTKGTYALGYGIDQESAIFISKEINGQPKYPCQIEYYRIGDKVAARCSHQGYTFVDFVSKASGAAELPETQVEDEWWIKVSRAVGGAEKSYDFAPHVVRVKSTYGTAYREELEGTLSLGESPWDPIKELLPQREFVSAHLDWPSFLGREITLEAPLDPEAFWPHVDTIGGSRWPGENGGPKRG
jgi:acetoacetate decarboxylase